MDSKEFREFGKAAVDYIADYIDNIRDRPVLPCVSPGYLANLLPQDAPTVPDKWQEILPDLEKYIMPGITHWQSPNFNAYFPTGSSFPAVVGEMLSAGLGCVGFSWISSPACTELEMITLDWLGKLIGLPDFFLNGEKGQGGGMIQGSASEATFVALLAARDQTVKRMKRLGSNTNEHVLRGKLVAYTSELSNSSVEKAGLLGAVHMKFLPADRQGRIRGSTLERVISEDRNAGFIPFLMVATLGTTGICSNDCLDELGPICSKENLWLHVDAAYAGNACVCPEYRFLLKGVEYADSFCINPHKWLLVNFDCSAMWIKDTRAVEDSFYVDRIYLKQDDEPCKNNLAPDLRHRQIPLGRRFRALKLWITMRLYGVQGLQKHIRNHCALAEKFQSLVEDDDRFELVFPATMGLVCFRLKGEDYLTQQLLESIVAHRLLYMVAATFQGKFFLRFVVCSRLTNESDIDSAWSEIRSRAKLVLNETTRVIPEQ